MCPSVSAQEEWRSKRTWTRTRRVKECRAFSVIAMNLHLEVNCHFKFINFMLMLGCWSMPYAAAEEEKVNGFASFSWQKGNGWRCRSVVSVGVYSTCYYSISSIRYPFKCNEMQTFASRTGKSGAGEEPFDHPHLDEMCVMLMRYKCSVCSLHCIRSRSSSWMGRWRMGWSNPTLYPMKALRKALLPISLCIEIVLQTHSCL